MSTRKTSTDIKLEREEKELLRALVHGDLKYQAATKAERDEATGAARAKLKRDKRMIKATRT